MTYDRAIKVAAAVRKEFRGRKSWPRVLSPMGRGDTQGRGRGSLLPLGKVPRRAEGSPPAGGGPRVPAPLGEGAPSSRRLASGETGRMRGPLRSVPTCN